MNIIGVDACNTVLEVVLFAAAMNLGQSWYTVLTLFGGKSTLKRDKQLLIVTATLTFYIQTWDEYYTQTLTLGIVSGPVEGIVTLCLVYAFTAVKGGGSFWQQSMLNTVGISKYEFIPDYVYNMPFNQWYMVYGGIVLVFNTVQRFVASLDILSSISNKSITVPSMSLEHERKPRSIANSPRTLPFSAWGQRSPCGL